MPTLIDLSSTTVHYAVTADAHPAALPRVLELFARRNITPDLVRVSKYRAAAFREGNLSIDVHVSGLSADEQKLILQKLAAQVSVQNVREEVLLQKGRAKLVS